MNLYDFTNQTLVANAYNVEHVGVAHALCDNQGTCHFFDYAFAHLLPPRQEHQTPVNGALLPVKYYIRANCLLY